jgi:hypothetical protein
MCPEDLISSSGHATEAVTSLWARDAAPVAQSSMVALIADGLRYGVCRCE